MNDSYYVIEYNGRYLSYISSSYINGSSTYTDAIKLTTTTMVEQFKAYCLTIEPDTTFTIYHVQITISAVNLTQVGEE